MKWQQDWEELVCSLQRGRANEESSLREKKGYTIFRDRFDHVSRTFHRSKEHRQAYIRIGLAHDPPFLSYFLRSLLYYYIPRPTVRENQRKCAANKISHVILRSILRSPIHHDRDNASAIRSSWSRDSPRARGEESWRKKKKSQKSPRCFAHTVLHTFSSSILRPFVQWFFLSLLLPPPLSPSPAPSSSIFLSSKSEYHRVYILRMPRFDHRRETIDDAATRRSGKNHEGRREQGVASTASRIHQSTKHPGNSFSARPSREHRRPRYTGIQWLTSSRIRSTNDRSSIGYVWRESTTIRQR